MSVQVPHFYHKIAEQLLRRLCPNHPQKQHTEGIAGELVILDQHHVIDIRQAETLEFIIGLTQKLKILADSEGRLKTKSWAEWQNPNIPFSHAVIESISETELSQFEISRITHLSPLIKKLIRVRQICT
jgi:hypothetical protein